MADAVGIPRDGRGPVFSLHGDSVGATGIICGKNADNRTILHLRDTDEIVGAEGTPPTTAQVKYRIPGAAHRETIGTGKPVRTGRRGMMPNTAIRTRLGLAASLAALLVSSAAACRAGAEAAPAGAPGTATCPDTFVEGPRPTPSRSGPLVPEGATTALLCVYAFTPEERPGVYHLSTVVQDVTRPPRVVDHLNALAGVDRTATNACSLMAHDQYQVVLGYPSNTHTVVKIDFNCGTASSAGAVRALRRVDTLLKLWPDR